jgi:drug/metabolite transporter (DMT)-like permease
VGTLLFLPAVPLAWRTPESLLHWGLFGALGALATLGHFILIRAFDYAPATVLAPLVYTQLVWVLLLGALVFGDFPDAWSLAGMAIIVAAGLYVIHRQRLAVRSG